ncbi:MAG TPA: EpsI family protein [Candidatus Krumholzibacteria bacterium]|nr:EpsI family protein [Candidatus Krumholzibacteria bacterium]
MALRLLIAAAVVALGGVYARTLAGHRVAVTAMPALSRLPATVEGGWSAEDVPLSERVAGVLDADATLQRLYRHPSGAQVWLFVAYFAEQAVNSQIHSPRHCVPGSGWNVLSVTDDRAELSRGPTQVARMRLQRSGGGDEQEMFYWFRTRGGTVTGEYALKWDLLRNAVARRPTDALFVRYVAPSSEDAAVRQVMRSLDPYLESLLAEVGLQ